MCAILDLGISQDIDIDILRIHKEGIYMDSFKKYKIDRVPRELLFVLGRVAMIVLVNIFAVFMGEISCSVIATVLGVIFENSNEFVTLKLIPFLTNDVTTSFVGWLILLGLMLRIFWDDGKRQTAYGRFDIRVGFAAVFFMFAVYFIPSIFVEKTKDALEAGIVLFYRPCLWMSEQLNGNVSACVMITGGLIALLCLVIYKVSSDRYLKKYAS